MSRRPVVALQPAQFAPLAEHMRFRFLGKTGLQVSELGFGSWLTMAVNTAQQDTDTLVAASWNAGVNLFDTAEVYANGEAETLLGNTFRRLGLPRDEMVVTTKVFWGGKKPTQRGLSRKHVVEGTYASLRRLQLDHVDLLFAHRPDPDTPMEETVRAFNYLIEQGHALYWGTSEWSAQQLQEAHGVCDRLGLIKPVMEQPEYNVFTRKRVESEYAPLFVSEAGLGLTTWSPLASGLLTGKYNDGIPEGSRLAQGRGVPKLLRKELESEAGQHKLQQIRALGQVASAAGLTTGQLAIKWCLANERVSSVLLGASNIKQLGENLGSVVLPALQLEVLEAVEQIMRNKPKDTPSWR